MSHLIPWPVPPLIESLYVRTCGLCVCEADHECVYVVEKEARREIQEILGSGPIS